MYFFFIHSTTLHLTALLYSVILRHSLSIFSWTQRAKLLQNTVRRLRKLIITLGRREVKTSRQPKGAEYFDCMVLDYFFLFNGIYKVVLTSKSGRRYEMQKIFALATYYHSPKTYRFLSSIFKLPSPSRLHSWLWNVSINVGWSNYL